MRKSRPPSVVASRARAVLAPRPVVAAADRDAWRRCVLNLDVWLWICRSAKFLKIFFFIRVYVTTVYDRTSNEWPGSALCLHPIIESCTLARDRESAHRGRRGVRGGPGMAWGMAAGVRPQSRLILDLAALSSLFTWGWEAAGSAGLAGPHAQSARPGG